MADLERVEFGPGAVVQIEDPPAGTMQLINDRGELQAVVDRGVGPHSGQFVIGRQGLPVLRSEQGPTTRAQILAEHPGGIGDLAEGLTGADVDQQIRRLAMIGRPAVPKLDPVAQTPLCSRSSGPVQVGLMDLDAESDRGRRVRHRPQQHLGPAAPMIDAAPGRPRWPGDQSVETGLAERRVEQQLCPGSRGRRSFTIGHRCGRPEIGSEHNRISPKPAGRSRPAAAAS